MSGSALRGIGLIIILVCLSLFFGCSGGNNAVQPLPGENPDSTKVSQAQFKGHVELPNSDIALSEYKVQVANGIFEIKPDGSFEVPMNMGTTGLITVLDPNGKPVLLKVFPKHELLREKEPVVNAESTAVAYMYLNPALARINNPLKAAVLLENLRRTDAVRNLTVMINNSFSSREACYENDGFWNLVGKGFDELVSKSTKRAILDNPEARKGQSDQDDPWFFDRDQKDFDKIDMTNFQLNGTSVTIDYRNNGYKWWMVTIDPTSSAPDYIPSYRSDYTNSQITLALIPPASFEIPSLKEIIDDIQAQTIAGIAGWISNNYWDFMGALAKADHSTLVTPEGEISFELPNWSQTFQISGYSMGFKNDLITTDPDSPDRSNIPSLFQIIYQLVIPVFSIYFDGAEYVADPKEICGYTYAPQFDVLLAKLNPSFEKLHEHLYNYQGRLVLNDCYEIIGKTLSGGYERWFVKNVIFNGNIPDPILSQIIYTVLSSQKLTDVSEQFGMCMGSMVYSFEIPNFDSYIIDMQKYPSGQLPYDLKVVSINRGEAGADPELITSIDLDWDDIADAYEYTIERADGFNATKWDEIDTCSESSYKYILNNNDWDEDYRFRILAHITGNPNPEISQEVFTLFVSDAGNTSYNLWTPANESNKVTVAIWTSSGNPFADGWPTGYKNAIGVIGMGGSETLNLWAVGRSKEIPDLVGQSEAFCDGYMYMNTGWKGACGWLMGTLSNPNPSGSYCGDFIPENRVYNNLYAYNCPDMESLNREFCTTNQAGWANFENNWFHVGYYLDGILNPDRDYFAFGFASGNQELNYPIGWSDAWVFIVQ